MRARTTAVLAAAATLAMAAVTGLAAAQPPLPGPSVPGQAPQPQPVPPGTPYRIGYVSTAESDPAGTEGEPADVWSADESGGDRVNHTARPNLRDDGPAFSPDGEWLAYSAQDAGGGARIIVADAEGRDGRTLAPAGTLATDRDLDPTWSPDGTMIAFTRERAGVDGETSSEILVVRVADGGLAGWVPMPPHLSGRDLAPAWSPDGTRLAFARTAARRPPPTADPPIVDVPATPGEALDVPVGVLVPVVPAHPDVVFLIDASRSMQDAIDDIAANVASIVDDVRAEQPTAQFAVAAYRDGESALAEEVLHFEVLQPLTGNPDELVTALSGLTAVGGGADGPEDWIYPLHQLATGTPDLPADSRIEFVSGRTPIVVLIGDASSKEPSVAPGGSGHRLTATGGGDGDTMLALLAAGVLVVAVDVDSGSLFADGLNGDRTRGFLRPPVPGQGTLVADRTGGRFVPPGQGAGAVSAAVRDGLLGLPVPVEALVETCDPGLSATVTPPNQGVAGGEVASFALTLTVAGGVAAGTVLRCTVSYGLGDGSRVMQEVAVRVRGTGVPRVRVDDQMVDTGDPAGAVVAYAATAVDAGGYALTPVCAPPSGTRFPVGQTLVTCTATDADGNTGSDTALVTVVLGPADGLTRLWLATLGTSGGGGTVTVTEQVDLSARIAAVATDPACAGGSDDTEPAWSPDAASVVFVDTGESGALCVVEVAGAVVRELPSVGRPGDPAWSPDGLLVAFGVDRDSLGVLEQDQVWTVVADGAAPAEPLIAGGGHHGDPAFRLLPVPVSVPAVALTASVVPRPGFVGGDPLTVRFRVRNPSTVALTEAVLTAVLPGALTATATGGCESATRCVLGALPAGGTAEVLVRLAPDAILDTVVTGRVTGSTSDGRAASASATAPVVVVEPTLEISPELGPPGLVAQASGTDFPAGAEVRLVWRDGITATDNTLTVAPDGTFTWQALVFRKDELGPRELHAEPVTGPGFGTATVEFLVVPPTQQPPLFEGR